MTRRRFARKHHYCWCGRLIAPGDAYLESTEFPGHDAGYATTAGHPVTHRECARCAERHGRGYLINEPTRPELEAWWKSWHQDAAS